MEKLLAIPAGIWRFLKMNRGPLLLVAVIAVSTLLFLAFYYYPMVQNIGPVQPIPFSHRVHAGIKGINCEFCHPYVSRGTFPGLPAVEKCLFCHKYIITTHPEIMKEHEYFNTDTPTPWVKVNYIPEHVLFNHQRHIKKNIDCVQCHGDIKSMDRLKSNHFQMGFCVQCHRLNNAPLDCWLACHN